MKLQDFNTLESAKAYSVKRSSMIHRDTMNGWLGGKDIYIRFKDIAETPGHPFNNKLAAFLDSVEFNFIEGSETGDSHIALMDALIAYEPTVQNELTELRPKILAKANPVVYPFKDATQHDFNLAKGTITRKAVTQTEGVLTITTTADCESHSPQVYQYIASADYYKRVAGFRDIEKAGTYKIEVPRLNNLFVDNAYGVVS